MELAWLEDFLALSSTGVFAKAADARNISQSAFTRRIKNLEHWVGTPLFDRSVHPVCLTPSGEAFKRTAYESVKALREARQDLIQLSRREGELLNFVALHTLAISFIPSWLKDVSSFMGPFNSRFGVENFSDCVEALIAGTTDFMLCYDHPSVPTMTNDARYPWIKIAQDRLVAVSGVDAEGAPIYRLDTQGTVPFIAYSHESFLGRMSDIAISRAGIAPQLEKRMENSVAEAQKAACVEGLGVAWLPEATVKQSLAQGDLVRISDAESEQSMSIKLYRNIEKSRAPVERFWTLVGSAGMQRH
ncbi:LysR substrate-binding domain-containing protein [Cognatishimia sp. SS12]|uniref:LysR substrate-binding domain-containing protein n=1 Tax=Cognatishimia sp. SS12 TaxID=2979465 RepID=UPI002330CC92|nr:LysR substrate-binding domain-containing protein [Cognatishimia sp. SS12]MDC0738293.1 LysR substrate-binding domain-containing protein [Cognatishimia sp. SS12]